MNEQLRPSAGPRVTRVVVSLVIAVAVAVAACGSGTPSNSAPLPATDRLTAAHAGTDAPADSPAGPAAVPAGSAATLPSGALTIVALGDSLTAGEGDDSGNGGYVGRLQSLIALIRPGSTTTNLGHSGWTSSDLIKGRDADPSELRQALDAHPSVALVWIGSNDLWYLYEYGPDPMTADAESTDQATYAANVETILRGLTDQGVAVFIALLDDQSKRPVVAHPNATEPAFPGTSAADLTRMSAQVGAYNRIIAQAAARFGATTVDFHDATIFTDAATLAGDGNHPNAAGYDRIAAIWLAAIKSRLG